MAVQQEEGLNNQGTINFNDFAVSIKEKYPMYKDLDNEYLAKEIIKNIQSMKIKLALTCQK